jgi:thiamine-phosphate pyrophosphorylase
VRTILITDVQRYGRERTLEVIHQAFVAGVEAVQVHEKEWMARELLGFVVEILSLAEEFGARVIVNDRLDIALSSGAHGVHLDDDALHPEAARELVRRLERDDFLIGVLVHNRADVARASAGMADYALFGPLYSSPDEDEFGPPLGINAFGVVCADKWVPVLAVGGITPENAGEVLAAGAAGVACKRAIFEADDPGDAARRLVEATR